jgi:hypothetical protein
MQVSYSLLWDVTFAFKIKLIRVRILGLEIFVEECIFYKKIKSVIHAFFFGLNVVLYKI